MTRSLLALLLAAGTLAGCADAEPTDDAGDAAFVQQVVPAVLGRKVRGSVELNVLNQIVEDYGRDVLLDVLFEQPEFVDYWSYVLMNRLEVTEITNQNVSPFARYAECFTNSTYNPTDDATLAQNLVDHLRDDPASDTSISNFTMKDVLRASILTDDLSPVYRAWMLALPKDYLDDDEYWVSLFMQTSVLGRDPNCESCHTSAWSTTDDPTWDRFHPTPFNLEKSVYGRAGDVSLTAQEPMCVGCHGNTGTDTVDTSPADGRSKTLSTRVPVLTMGKLSSVLRHGTGSGMPDLGLSDDAANGILYDLQGDLGSVDGLQSFVDDDTLLAGSVPLGMSTLCAPTVDTSYTDGIYPGWFAGQKPVHPTLHHVLDAYIDGVDGVQGEVAAAGFDYATNPWEAPLLSGPASFAWMTAAHSVDTIAEEVLGARYTLSHGYARNEHAGLTHDVLTAQFIENGWSLRETLRSLVMSNSFNRRKPSESLVTSTAYPLLPRLNPWAEPQPGTETGAPGEDRNGTGDLVHRYSPYNLWWSTADGLGFWPPYFQYPNLNVQRGVGDHVDFYAPGFDRWSMSSLLWWETYNGSCNIGESFDIGPNGTFGVDWVYRATRLAVGWDVSDDGLSQFWVGSTATYRDLFEAVRDRLLADPALTDVEEAQLAAMIAPVPLDGLVAGIDTTASDVVQTWARRYCGALLKSPDYLLAGVAPVTVATNDFPALDVCYLEYGGADQPCGIAEVCDYWETELDALGSPYDHWSCDETPGVDEPFTPVGADAYVAEERELAEDYGYAWEDAYTFEKLDEQKAQAAEASLPERAAPLTRDEIRWISKYNMSLRTDARFWSRLAAVNNRTLARDTQRFLAAQELDYDPPQWVGEVPPSAVADAAQKESVMASVAAAEAKCRASGHVDCISASWTEVTSTSSSRGETITDTTIDEAYTSFEAAYEKAQNAERLGDGGSPQPEVTFERIR